MVEERKVANQTKYQRPTKKLFKLNPATSVSVIVSLPSTLNISNLA